MGERDRMSVPAHALPADPGEPVDVPGRVQEIRDAMDWDMPLPARARGPLWQLQQAVKRGADIVLSGAGLVALAPVFAVLALAVTATSPGPVFYPWRVLGRHGRPFVGYKFRTMVADADLRKMEYLDRNEMRGPVFKIRDDPRVTPLGRWLRRYSLDELPQLWSVFRGDMSLVGPRPPSAEEFVRFEPWQWGKLAVTPGITCLWQIGGRTEISDFDAWVRLDLEYIRRWNLWLDFVILIRTIPAVLSGRGAY